MSGKLPDNRPVTVAARQPKSRAAKTERLEARITAELKETIAHAARLAGRSITDFVLESVQRSAHETILEHEVIRLNARESASFVRALLHPPKPNPKLRAAFASYRKNAGPA